MMTASSSDVPGDSVGDSFIGMLTNASCRRCACWLSGCVGAALLGSAEESTPVSGVTSFGSLGSLAFGAGGGSGRTSANVCAPIFGSCESFCEGSV